MTRALISCILCLLLTIGCMPESAQADTQELSVLCRTPHAPNGTLCTVLISDDQIYVDARTAAHLAGYELTGSMPGGAQFRLGNRRVNHTGVSLNASGQSWYPIESIMDTLTTRVIALGGELFFSPASSSLQALDEAIENYRRMDVAVDPDDGITAFGLELAKAFDILSNLSFADLINHSYEREIYQSAVFALLRRGTDSENSTFGALFKQLEQDVTMPLHDLFGAADVVFSEEVMRSFYGGSSLGRLYDIIDAYDQIADGMGFSDLVCMAEEIDFYASVCTSAETGFRYLMETDHLTEEEQRILEEARRPIQLYKQQTGDIYALIGDMYLEASLNLAESALKDKMFGFLGEKIVKAVSLGVEYLMPGVAAMDELEMCAVFYRIQQIAAQQIEQALAENDYLRLKYCAILYYRCAYLSTLEISKMDIEGMAGMLINQRDTLNTLEESLLAIPDSTLINLSFTNDHIYPNALLGPAAIYVEFYNGLMARYGELNVRNYYGTEYLEEGNGIIAPWMHYIGDDTLLTVLRQEGSDLIQTVYLDRGNTGTPILIDERTVLTCGSNGSIYYGFADESGLLLSCTGYGTTLTSYAFNGDSVESYFYESEPHADSISAMRQSAWNRLYTQFGEYQPAFTVDGSDGLFRISHSPAEMRTIFLQQFNRP